MAEAQFEQFKEKIRQLNAFVALSEAEPELHRRLVDCSSHTEVVAIAAEYGFDIGRRWGQPPSDLAAIVKAAAST